jgi:hypothetical protein
VARHRLLRLLELDEDWDSYGGHPLDREIAIKALGIVGELARFDVPVPDLIPTSAGGLQLEWQRPGFDLEITLQPDEMATVFFLDRATRQFAEKPLAGTGTLFDILSFFGTAGDTH